MSWRCSGITNHELVHNLKSEGLLKHPNVVAAFQGVYRANYVANKRDACEDSPSYIGFGATISAPHMHAHAVENLLPLLKPGANVLDIGCGSGYLLGIFNQLVYPGGTVLGIEHIQGLVDLSRNNLAREPATRAAMTSSPPSILLALCDGRKGSPPEMTPKGGWDAIHVGAAAPHIPQALIDQLASPGRMFIPVGTVSQSIMQVDKDEHGVVHKKHLFGVNYVPLTDPDLQYP